MYEQVLMCDEIPSGNIARYELMDDVVAIVYSPRTQKIVRAAGAEILVPETNESEDESWDNVLMMLLDKSTKPERVMSAKSIDDAELLTKVNRVFDDMEIYDWQVIVNPLSAKPIDELNMIESTICPQDRAYFVPMPAFLGVVPTRNKKPTGMSVINPHLVITIDLKAG